MQTTDQPSVLNGIVGNRLKSIVVWGRVVVARTQPASRRVSSVRSYRAARSGSPGDDPMQPGRKYFAVL